jgi:transcriptional regulator with XRE-family HTH domain
MAPRSELSRLVGRRIALLRQRAGLSQRELADRLGWTRDVIAHYELGRRELGLERLSALAAALRVSPPTLLADDERAPVLLALDAHPELLGEVLFFLSSLKHGGDLPPP